MLVLRECLYSPTTVSRLLWSNVSYNWKTATGTSPHEDAELKI